MAQLLQYVTEAIGRKPALWIIWAILTVVSEPQFRSNDIEVTPVMIHICISL